MRDCTFIRHFDPDRGAPPLAWLTLTQKRECWAKGRRSVARCAAQEGDPSPDRHLERAEWVLEARQCLARLKLAERRVLFQIGAGYSYAEVGEMNGWTPTKVNRSAAEGRARLRALQQSLGDSEGVVPRLSGVWGE
jgi:DNA-directed RNA polymerase specialized sigma24 family protein